MKEKVDEIVDPVSGFAIPGSWREKSKDPQALEKVKSGLWVLLSDGTLLRRGYTTGTTAAAACKGAIISLARPADQVEVLTPARIRVTLPVKSKEGFCTAIKESGDHEFDITSGMAIEARAELSENTGLVAGLGIGRIGSRGLCAPLGKPAISQSARQEIMGAIEEGLKETKLAGAQVELIVPRGEEIASQTLNPKVGVIGGISILGSTGFVEPWNEHLGDNRIAEIRDLDKVVVTTGRIGLKYSRILFPHHKAVLVGNRFDGIKFSPDQDSIICGLPALILKWGMPQILEETEYRTVAEMIEHQSDHPKINLALKKVKEKLPRTRIVLLQRNGRILRDELP
ncbi:MAG: cobalt-precorrin-5B (C(1))-methyltransferase [Methanotrichaceae archaeon]